MEDIRIVVKKEESFGFAPLRPALPDCGERPQSTRTPSRLMLQLAGVTVCLATAHFPIRCKQGIILANRYFLALGCDLKRLPP
jgi:hypothetical protein